MAVLWVLSFLYVSPHLLYNSISSFFVADLAVAAFAILVWSLFLLHVTNAERLSSSVLRQVTYQLRNSEEVKRAIGGGVRYAENWWGESCVFRLFFFFVSFRTGVRWSSRWVLE